MQQTFSIDNTKDLTHQIINDSRRYAGSIWKKKDIELSERYFKQDHFYIGFYYRNDPYLATCSVDPNHKPLNNLQIMPLYSPYGDRRKRYKGCEITL